MRLPTEREPIMMEFLRLQHWTRYFTAWMALVWMLQVPSLYQYDQPMWQLAPVMAAFFTASLSAVWVVWRPWSEKAYRWAGTLLPVALVVRGAVAPLWAYPEPHWPAVVYGYATLMWTCGFILWRLWLTRGVEILTYQQERRRLLSEGGL